MSRVLGGRFAQRGDEVMESAAVAVTNESDGVMMTAELLLVEVAIDSEGRGLRIVLFGAAFVYRRQGHRPSRLGRINQGVLE